MCYDIRSRRSGLDIKFVHLTFLVPLHVALVVYIISTYCEMKMTRQGASVHVTANANVNVHVAANVNANVNVKINAMVQVDVHAAVSVNPTVYVNATVNITVNMCQCKQQCHATDARWPLEPLCATSGASEPLAINSKLMPRKRLRLSQSRHGEAWAR